MFPFAAVATHPGVSRWVAIDAPLPGIGPWEQILQEPSADDVEDAVIPDCGHWITEEQPQATTDLVVNFLRRG